MTDLPAAPFSGWLRDALPWRQVAAGPTISACWAELLKMAAVGNHAERLVLKTGRRPGERSGR